MRFRIGLHLGDVMSKGGDLLGDVVNIAARLQALAEPGGICVSAAVREHVGTRAVAAFTDAGLKQVKNIAEMVHVFRVAARGSAPPPIEPPAALPLPDKPSVTVLPFTNMSADPEQALPQPLPTLSFDGQCTRHQEPWTPGPPINAAYGI